MLQAVKCQDGHGDKYYKINIRLIGSTSSTTGILYL